MGTSRKYWHPREMRNIPCPYQPKRLTVTYFEDGERVRRWFQTEKAAADFAASLPSAAQAIQHSN